MGAYDRENKDKKTEAKEPKSQMKAEREFTSTGCYDMPNGEDMFKGPFAGYSDSGRGPFWQANAPWTGFYQPASHPQSENILPLSEYEPATVLYEEDEHLIISIELPNVKEQDINIQWNDNMIIVKGEKKAPIQENEKPIRRSRSYWTGVFQQMINLGFVPEGINQIKAKHKDGVLTLKIKMPVSTKPKTASIQISN